MEMKKLVQGLTAAGLIALTGNTFAATADGLLGLTSTGTVDVEVTVGDLVRITGLSPMTGNTYVPGSAVTDSTTACIYRNGSTGYQITMNGQNDNATDFFLNDGGANDVVYNVSFTGNAGATPMTPNAIAPFAGADTASETCGGGNNALISVSIPETDPTDNGLAEVPAGTYTDELTILLEVL